MLGLWILLRNHMYGRGWAQKVTGLLQECEYFVVNLKIINVCIHSVDQICFIFMIQHYFVGMQQLVPVQMACFCCVVEETLLARYMIYSDVTNEAVNWINSLCVHHCGLLCSINFWLVLGIWLKFSSELGSVIAMCLII